jgi:hypothetical protein
MNGVETFDIGPGIGAFFALLALAVSLWLLMRNMNGRMRRMAYAERDRLAALDAEAEAKATGGTDGSVDVPGDRPSS